MLQQHYRIAGFMHDMLHPHLTLFTHRCQDSPPDTKIHVKSQAYCLRHETSSDPDVSVCEHRPGPDASYQDAVQAWQEKHDDAALMAIADRVEQQQQIAVPDELHASAQVSKTSLTHA